MKQKLLELYGNEPKDSITAVLLSDAGIHDEDTNDDDVLAYIKDVAEHGCVGGACRGLVYYTDTHRFYAEHAEEIDELLAELEEEIGEPYNITENMKRLGQSDLRNFLAWLAYEVTAQRIMQKLEE